MRAQGDITTPKFVRAIVEPCITTQITHLYSSLAITYIGQYYVFMWVVSQRIQQKTQFGKGQVIRFHNHVCFALEIIRV